MFDDERLDDLKCAGLFILQKKRGFRFVTDSVLLSAFVCEKMARRVFDLGTGSSVIPLLMSQRLPEASFGAVEIQRDIAEMAARSIEMNGLTGRIRVFHADARELPAEIPRGTYDLVTCNPPYHAAGTSLQSPEPALNAARVALTLTVDEAARSGSSLLRTGGRFCAVIPAHMFLSACDAMRAHRLEPKRARFVHDRADKPPYLVLLEGMRLARPGIAFRPPLIAHNSDGSETDELRRIYQYTDARGVHSIQ